MWIEDNILFLKYEHGIVLNKEIALSLVKERIRITDQKTYPVFIDIRDMKYTTREAREELSKGDGIKYVSASAFLINSEIIRILGDYFIRFNKPAIPVKLFTNEQKALQWLKQYTNKENPSRLGGRSLYVY